MLLQAPGVSQDSAASGSLHVRNDHANVQFRINGVMLPDGVTGFGSILDTGLIGNMSLVTGALPAEFGLRTVGLIDITTRTDAFNNSGSVSLYGGSRGTITPSFEYGGTFGGKCPATPRRRWQGAAVVGERTGAFPACNISSPAVICRPPRASKIRCRRSTPSTISRSRKEASPICRRSSTRGRGVSLIAGTSVNNFQIPNIPGAPPECRGQPSPCSGSPLSIRHCSTKTSIEQTQYGVLALQRSANGFDGQLSYFTRYNQSALHA